ncbi:hypothetical protein B0H12DRAFT_1155632 [Mycena haematopus]|nr:hypothetical protein B0H12DRAFT_1155632 [Mycena haematopus]
MAPNRDPSSNPSDGDVFWRRVRAGSTTGLAFHLGDPGNPELLSFPLKFIPTTQPSVSELLNAVGRNSGALTDVSIYKYEADTRPVAHGDTIDLNECGLTMANPILFVDHGPNAQQFAQFTQDPKNWPRKDFSYEPPRQRSSNPKDGPVFWWRMRADSNTGLAFYLGDLDSPEPRSSPLKSLRTMRPSARQLVKVVNSTPERQPLIDVYKHGDTIDLDVCGLTVADSILFVDRNPDARHLAQFSRDLLNGTLEVDDEDDEGERLRDLHHTDNYYRAKYPLRMMERMAEGTSTYQCSGHLTNSDAVHVKRPER